jgi:trans-aconitate methyltransferase
VEYRLLTTESSSWIKRVSHGRRFRIAFQLLDLQQPDRFLDFGAGDGYLFRLLTSQQSGAEIFAFDPDPEMVASFRTSENAERVVADPSALATGIH